MHKKTVILGASPNPARYAYTAAQMMKENSVDFVPVGIKKGTVFGEEILDLRKRPVIDDVHTVTLYVGPQNQPEWYDYVLSLSPKRVIFNPGTENKEFMELLESNHIQIISACNLVMLSSGQF
ncbi:MAG: CoA-binding protein [Cyclobacteriaceae bacterium]